MIKKVCCGLVLILAFITLLTGCDIDNESENTIENKIQEEISYIEDKILTFFSMYAKNEYGTIDNLNWDLIEENAIELNNVLDSVILDMSEVEIPNENIINFKDSVNKLSIAVSNKDINGAFEEYRKLYALLPMYAEKSYSNKNEVKKLKLKSEVVSSYVYANLLDWEQAKNTINSAEVMYREMMDDVDYMKEYSYNLNKIFILINEQKNAIEVEEIELTKIKYVNFIEKI
ncbi:MAG: hypothetical protein IKL55_02715 [Clostridia bacterium]|nr:hypothetical protein [Clostridia bacterium]